MITKLQHQRLMKEFQKHGKARLAAMKTGMHRHTAAKYLNGEPLPEAEQRQLRAWRTRKDPVTLIWEAAERFLRDSPEIEAKSLFEHLLERFPTGNAESTLRTFQRRVLAWRREYGPGREVIFPQVHRPGEVLQLDWTHAVELGVTIAGMPFDHLFCQCVLPYSNWQYAMICRSESGLSLKRDLQGAFWALGGVTAKVQTDQSSTATHVLKRGQQERGFNEEYLALCAHYGVEPIVIAVDCPNQNGDVESQQGHLKRRLRNHLMLRGSKDFPSEIAYGEFVLAVCRAANRLRQVKIAEELAVLRSLPATRYPETEEVSVTVSSHSTARVKGCAYSVPSRLINATIEAQISETTVIFRHNHKLVAQYTRSSTQRPSINYRHIISSLLRKPGAFARYLYREELFPSVVFRQTYDRLVAQDASQADRWYVHVLALAAARGEDHVAEVLAHLLRENVVPLADIVKARLREPTPDPVNAIVPFEPRMDAYDDLLKEVGS